MAAHLRSIEHVCVTCGKRATKQLFTTWNDPQSYYCAPCGDRALKELWRLSPQQAPASNQR